MSSSTKRVNVLIYTGPGASLSSVRHATWSLRRLLGPNYTVQTISSDQLLKEPWPATCALLVFPGGADAGYCRVLNGAGNRRIKQYVQMGGKYLGLCAGGYYGSSKCEFEVGEKGMEVIGDRELGFFPGTCRGLAFAGFVYQSEAGAKAVELQVNQEAVGGTAPAHFKSYYNGGGVFVDAEKFQEQGVEVLASFNEELHVEAGKAKAAVVFRKVGEGAAMMTGPHPEFAGMNLNRNEPSNPNYSKIVDALLADDKSRMSFMKACLTKLGLQVSQEDQAVPSLSRLHLSSSQPDEITDLLQSWQEAGIISDESGEQIIKCEQDTFKLSRDDDPWNTSSLRDALPTPVKKAADVLIDAVATPTKPKAKPVEDEQDKADSTVDRTPDSEIDTLTTRLNLHTSSVPDPKETPHFNHHAFFSNLRHYKSKHPGIAGDYGRVLLYGEVMTSTQTLLEKNTTLLSHVPIGTTATATTQISARGRGTNVWVSPPGSLMFSTIFKHSMTLSTSAPVVFVQYLAAMAVVKGIHSYDHGYENLPIRLKWPNDIYALDPSKPNAAKDDPNSYVKIGGLIVHCSYSGGDYTVIPGIGLNVLENSSPTTSLSRILSTFTTTNKSISLPVPPLSTEKLLASILTSFETLYARFCAVGFDQQFEKMYYDMWLHSGQIVTLETEGGLKARIKGITTDWGLLVAEEVVERGVGRRVELQSDSNSFDFFRGLVKRKV